MGDEYTFSLPTSKPPFFPLNSSEFAADLVNSISEKNLRQTMDIYQKHLALDTNPREILGALIAEFRRMRVIKELYDAGDDYRTIANKMGAKSEYGIKMTIPRAKLMTMSEIDGILNDSAQYLQQINTGLLNDKMAMFVSSI